MSYFKKILVFIKKSKLNYLIQKYGEGVKNSKEFPLLNESMQIHYKNCDKFIGNLEKNLSKDMTYDIFYDDFEKYSHFEDFAEANTKKYDLIFSLGGDGTFLRSLNLNDSKNQLVVGINTDGVNSRGFYCCLNSMDEKIDEKLKNIFENKFKHKNLNKLNIEIIHENSCLNLKNSEERLLKSKSKSYNFINDLYYGERFMGRVSKYHLEVIDGYKKSFNLKSSGLIVSTCKLNFNSI